MNELQNTSQRPIPEQPYARPRQLVIREKLTKWIDRQPDAELPELDPVADQRDIRLALSSRADDEGIPHPVKLTRMAILQQLINPNLPVPPSAKKIHNTKPETYDDAQLQRAKWYGKGACTGADVKLFFPVLPHAKQTEEYKQQVLLEAIDTALSACAVCDYTKECEAFGRATITAGQTSYVAIYGGKIFGLARGARTRLNRLHYGEYIA